MIDPIIALPWGCHDLRVSVPWLSSASILTLNCCTTRISRRVHESSHCSPLCLVKSRGQVMCYPGLNTTVESGLQHENLRASVIQSWKIKKFRSTNFICHALLSDVKIAGKSALSTDGEVLPHSECSIECSTHSGLCVRNSRPLIQSSWVSSWELLALERRHIIYIRCGNWVRQRNEMETV